MSKYKYLYFTTLNPDLIQYKSICVESCPIADKTDQNTASGLSCDTTGNANVTQCSTVKCDLTKIAADDTYAKGGDILCVYKTTVLMDRICFPGDSQMVAGLSSAVTEKLD